MLTVQRVLSGMFPTLPVMQLAERLFEHAPTEVLAQIVMLTQSGIQWSNTDDLIQTILLGTCPADLLPVTKCYPGAFPLELFQAAKSGPAALKTFYTNLCRRSQLPSEFWPKITDGCEERTCFCCLEVVTTYYAVGTCLDAVCYECGPEFFKNNSGCPNCHTTLIQIDPEVYGSQVLPTVFTTFGAGSPNRPKWQEFCNVLTHFCTELTSPMVARFWIAAFLVSENCPLELLVKSVIQDLAVRCDFSTVTWTEAVVVMDEILQLRYGVQIRRPDLPVTRQRQVDEVQDTTIPQQHVVRNRTTQRSRVIQGQNNRRNTRPPMEGNRTVRRSARLSRGATPP